MTVSIADAYTQVLHARGTAESRGTSAGQPFPAESFSAIPKDIQELFSVQDGENPLKALSLGFRFLGAREITDAIANLREMVEVDETLPPAFLEFVPFVHTNVKTDVGVFTGNSGLAPGHVVEYHYETAEFVVWASGVANFLEVLISSESGSSKLGFEFPCQGKEVVALESAISWRPA